VTDLKVGTVVYGYANGVFGRDSYEDKIVIASGTSHGTPWLVLAEVDFPSNVWFASGIDSMNWLEQNLVPEPELDF